MVPELVRVPALWILSPPLVFDIVMRPPLLLMVEPLALKMPLPEPEF